MDQMKAFAVFEALPADHPNCFVRVERPVPEAKGRDLLVRVDAIAVNPTDVKDRNAVKGRLEDPLLLGWDFCGTVVATGSDVGKFAIGDKVIAAGDVSRPGCYAEYVLVDEQITGHKPPSLTDEQAASLPLTTLAAWEALFEKLKIPDARHSAKPALLVIGGAGGVGSMAIQFARQLSSCTVIATASRPQSRDWCLDLGAHHVIDHSGNMKKQLQDLGLDGVPFILNCSDNLPYWQLMSELVAPEGAVCLLSSTKAKLDLDLFMAKSTSIHYQLMFTPSLFQTETMARQGDILDDLNALIGSGKIRHVLTRSFGPMDVSSLARAHLEVEQGRMIGKAGLSKPI